MKMLLKENLALLLMMNIAVQGVYGDTTRDIFMDSPTACGKTFAAGDREVFRVKPRGTVGVSNPPTTCVVYFESSQASSNYKFEVVVEAASFRDCGLRLSIFDGKSTGGSYLRELGCGSTTSTAQFYSKDRAMSLLLKRTQNQYFFGSDYQLRIQLYYDTEGADEYIGTYKFPAGAIIGIVLGVIVIIAAAILLGWCYKNGRLPGLSPYDYPTTTVKASSENLSKSEAELDGVGSKNGAFVAWHNTEGKNVNSRRNFDLDDSTIWESLTSINTNNTKKDNLRPVGRNNWNGREVNRSGLPQNERDNNTKSFQRLDPNQLSNSPNTRIRGRKDGKMPDYDLNKNFDDDKDTYNTINDLERERGGQVSERLLRGKGTFGADDSKNKKQNSSGVFVNPDKEGYMYDYEHVQKLSGDSENVSKPKTQDFATELQAAIKRASLKRQKSENQTDSDGQGLSGKDTQNESSEFSSSAALNKQTDGEMTGPEAQSSPKPKKKKRKSSKERKSPKSQRRHKKKGSIENDESKSPDSKLGNVNSEGEEVPPEIYAPIFSGDEEVPEAAHQYQPGYQGNYPPAAPFDPRYPMGAYPAGMPGMYPPGMPYQQAGQAQWYVEANPNGQHKMAFAMTTHSQSDDSLRDNMAPNYTSTPYYPTQGSRPGPNDMTVVPSGTILDDPRLPEPGTSLVRYDEDPLSGVKTSQVVWTDARKDPTDPPPDSSSQITRKTITRITTKATQDELPDAPNPSLQDMSWRTAQGIQATRGHEPPFMSPTKSAYQANAIQYATETPERSNAGYYMGSQQSAPHPPAYISTGPVIHEAPKMNNAIRDRIVLHSEAES